MANVGRFATKQIPEDISTTQIPHEEWNNAHLAPEFTYKVDLKKADDDIKSLVSTFLQSLKNPNVSLDVARTIVILAHHLKDPMDVNTKILKERYQDGSIPLVLKSTQNQPSPQAQRMVMKWISESEKITPEEEKEIEKDPDFLSKDGWETSPMDASMKTRRIQKEVPVVEEASSSNLLISDLSVDDVNFYIFVAAFTTKVLAKSPQNLSSSWVHMIKNYNRFYGASLAPTTDNPTSAWFENLKAVMHNDSILTKTLIRMVVHLEDTLPPESSQAGMIRYLFCLPLSYAGMHAYKLFLAVKAASGLSSKFILESLVHPATVGALDTIVDILIMWESTAGAAGKKSGAFKYARLVGAQYFQKIQTKSCAALVYCLVKILKKYEQGEGTTFNPENIFGLARVGTALKQQMDTAADIIASTLPSERNMLSDVMRQAIEESDQSAHRRDDPMAN